MTITIPNIGNNPLVVIVAGKRYAYGAGETVTVPDEVGNEILRMQAAMDNPAPPVDIPFEDAGDNSAIQALGTRLSAVEDILPELPKVTSDDNNKVLTVDGGKWKAKTPSGGSGGGALVVTLTSSGSAMVANKTAGEIWTAAQTSAVVFVSSMGGDVVFPLISAMKQSSHYYFSFASVVDNSITAMTIEAVAADEYPNISMG